MNEYFLSFFLLLLAFLIKLSANKICTKAHVVAALSELPVDIMFLSTALTVPYMKLHSNEVIKTVSQQGKQLSANQLDLEKGVNLFVLYLLITVLVTILWRFSEKFFKGEKWLFFNILVLINFTLSLGLFLYILSILGEVIRHGI